MALPVHSSLGQSLLTESLPVKILILFALRFVEADYGPPVDGGTARPLVARTKPTDGVTARQTR